MIKLFILVLSLLLGISQHSPVIFYDTGEELIATIDEEVTLIKEGYDLTWAKKLVNGRINLQAQWEEKTTNEPKQFISTPQQIPPVQQLQIMPQIQEQTATQEPVVSETTPPNELSEAEDNWITENTIDSDEVGIKLVIPEGYIPPEVPNVEEGTWGAIILGDFEYVAKLYHDWNGEDPQAIVDAPNSCYRVGKDGTMYFADHMSQGFGAITTCDKMRIVDKGSLSTWTKIDQRYGKNVGGNILLEDGTRAADLYSMDWIAYTCIDDTGENILITFWTPIGTVR